MQTTRFCAAWRRWGEIHIVCMALYYIYVDIIHSDLAQRANKAKHKQKTAISKLINIIRILVKIQAKRVITHKA